MTDEQCEHRERLLLRIPAACDTLQIGRATFYELLRRGEIRAIHIGRSVRIPRDELERWVRRQREDD